MSSTTAGVIFVVSLVVVLAAVNRPAGDYLYRVFTSTRHSRLERGLYRVIGVDPEAEQRGASTPAACSPSPWSPCSSSTC